MEKNQYDLCLEVLRRFSKANLLKDFILIGSWCLVFYKNYFKNDPLLDYSNIKTRDIDFLINIPSKIQNKIDIPDLLKDLGFVVTFRGHKGYIKLNHPKLILEFLVPERGKGINKPYPLPKLGVNAVTLKFLMFLVDNTINVNIENFTVRLPHPANFALHKLIISQRRRNEEKATKDANSSIRVLKLLVKKGESEIIKSTFNFVPSRWQKKIISGLKEMDEKEIIEILEK